MCFIIRFTQDICPSTMTTEMMIRESSPIFSKQKNTTDSIWKQLNVMPNHLFWLNLVMTSRPSHLVPIHLSASTLQLPTGTQDTWGIQITSKYWEMGILGQASSNWQNSTARSYRVVNVGLRCSIHIQGYMKQSFQSSFFSVWTPHRRDTMV